MRIRVAGVPAPQGSKRHVGGGRMVEVSRAVGPWREAVRAETQRAITITEYLDWGLPVAVEILFLLPRPKGHYSTAQYNAGQVRKSAPRFPGTRPDLDKLARAVLDGLQAGGALADDGQVVDLYVSKRYADGQGLGAVIELSEPEAE